MSRITASIEEAHEEMLGEIRDRERLSSDAAAMRRAIDLLIDREIEIEELESHVEGLQQEIHDLEARLDRKQSQISLITAMVLRSQLSNPDELDALFPGMDIPELEAPEASSSSIEERRMRAGAIQRAKWWAFGMPQQE